MEIADIKKVEKLQSEMKEKRVHCEKCKMTETLVGMPIVVKRKFREWERIHTHSTIRKSIFNRLGVKV